jgi:hypothetical protein
MNRALGLIIVFGGLWLAHHNIVEGGTSWQFWALCGAVLLILSTRVGRDFVRGFAEGLGVALGLSWWKGKR